MLIYYGGDNHTGDLPEGYTYFSACHMWEMIIY